MQTVAVLGAGPGLGLAVARRFGRGGYRVVLVARRGKALEGYVRQLASQGIDARAVVGNLADIDAFPGLASRVREVGGEPDVVYFAPTASGMTFTPAADLTVEAAEANVCLLYTAMVASVREFLPHMIEQESGAILTAQGATALSALPGMSGPGPAMAAQRHYLRSLGREVCGQGVSVGRLYISGLIRGSAIDVAAAESGKKIPKMATLDPNKLAGKLWKMREGGRDRESVVPFGGQLMMPLMASAPMRRLARRG